MRVNRLKFEQLFPFSFDLIPDIDPDPIFLDQASVPDCGIARRILNASICDDVEESLVIWGVVGEVRNATHRQNLVAANIDKLSGDTISVDLDHPLLLLTGVIPGHHLDGLGGGVPLHHPAVQLAEDRVLDRVIKDAVLPALGSFSRHVLCSAGHSCCQGYL